MVMCCSILKSDKISFFYLKKKEKKDTRTSIWVRQMSIGNSEFYGLGKCYGRVQVELDE